MTDDLNQIKRHRRGLAEEAKKDSLTHGKKTPEKSGDNEHEPRSQRGFFA
jgi:hypothetical protein